MRSMLKAPEREIFKAAVKKAADLLAEGNKRKAGDTLNHLYEAVVKHYEIELRRFIKEEILHERPNT